MPTAVILIAFCYSVALVFELLRFVRKVRRPWSHWEVLLPVAIGFVCHTAFLYRTHVVADEPIGGVSMFFFTAAWGLILISLLWTYYYPNIPFGIILLPITLLLLGGGSMSVSPMETTGLSLRSLAKMLHVASAAGFVIALSVWCICKLLYLLEVHLLRKKRSLTPPTKLPSLEWSSSLSRIALMIAVVCLCLCGLGIMLFWML